MGQRMYLSGLSSYRCTIHNVYPIMHATHPGFLVMDPREERGFFCEISISCRMESGRNEPHPVWKILWERKVPPKVHIFTWRALHGIVPCYCTLADKYIKIPVTCPVCKIGQEDLRHMLFLARELVRYGKNSVY